MNFVEMELPFDEAENYLQPSNKDKLNRLFYKDKNFEKLLQETTYFLIGDKGSGKTTYSAYFCNNTLTGNLRSKRYVITVDDYHKIIQMKKEGKLNYSHYVTLWKAIILIKLFSTIQEDEIAIWGGSAYKKIKDLLAAYNFTSFSENSFSPINFIDNEKFYVVLKGEGKTTHFTESASIGRECANEKQGTQHIYVDELVRFINNLTNDLYKLRLKGHHYLFIDGIDSRPFDIKFEDYKECVYPLIRAVYEVNTEILSKIKDRSKGRLQVVLLTRLDIFIESGLSNPGSKIYDNSVFLNWGLIKEDEFAKSSLFSLVNNILNSNSNENEKISWKNYFNFKINNLPSFVYFLRITTARPRDFVKILKFIQEQCIAQSIDNPTQQVVLSDLFMRSYSTYFTDSVRTMLNFYYDQDEIGLLFAFLRSIRANKFDYSTIVNKYKDFSENRDLERIFGGCNDILKILFNANMICYIESGSRFRWKYREITMANYDFNMSENILKQETEFRIHPALEKEFGLYS